MKVSGKILVIIYIIFALLISVVILASQSILYSSFSDLQEKEAAENVERVKDIIDFQVLHLEGINSALSSRDDVRALMLNQHPQSLSETAVDDVFSVSGCDFIFLVNSSGNIVYSKVSDSEVSTNASILPDILQRINDGSLLCKEAETPLKGLIMLENEPAFISSQPVLAASGINEISGTIILGKKFDSSFIESIQESTGSTVTLYTLKDSSLDFQQTLLESKNPNFIYNETGDQVTSYSVIKDISGSPTVVIQSDTASTIYAEGQKVLRYLVFLLLFSGLIAGASFKFLLDREVISRIVAIDNFVRKARTDENFSERFFVDGNDELSRLSEGINQTLDRLRATSDKFKAQEHEKMVILDSLTELVVFMDSELKIIWLNKAALDHMGMGLEDVIGRNYKDIYTI
jgi:sensor domain CHASE-containing protein